jgi:hypothetical protein
LEEGVEKMSEQEKSHENAHHEHHEGHEHSEHSHTGNHEQAHHEKHGAHATAAEKKGISMNQGTMVLAVVFLLIGIIVGAMVGYAMMAGSQQQVTTQTTNTATGSVDLSALKLKVESYVNDNLLPDASVRAKITDANSFGNGLYELSYVIDQNGQQVSQGSLFATEQKLLLVGGVFDLNKPIAKTPTAPTAPQTFEKSDKPAVSLFVMAFCPYGIQAETAFKPAIQLLDKSIDFSLGYVIYPNFAKQYSAKWSDYCFDENQTYCSMHGIGELNEDIRQLCIQKYQKDKLWAYLTPILADYEAGKVSATTIESKWKDYATAAGVDTAKVESCVSAEAESLLAGQVQLNAQYGVQGSPTAIINGTQYSGSRAAEAFKTTICSAFNTAPGDCNTTLGTTAATASTGGCATPATN